MELGERVDWCLELLEARDPTVTGASIGLLVGDHIEVVVGGARQVGGPEVSASTVWEAASLSKPVVALLALGRTNATDRSTRLVVGPEDIGAAPDERWVEVTLLHLLTHTSGLPNWRVPGEPLRFEFAVGTPGYSGEGYELLLAEVVARTGEAVETLVAEQLRSLGMHQSSFVRAESAGDDVALGTDDEGNVVPKAWPSVPRAAGSLQTTTSDYASFLSVVLHADDAATALLRQPAGGAVGDGRTLGWASSSTTDGAVLWQHGDNPGFKHVAALRPATGEAVVVFTNSDLGQDLYRQVCRTMLDVEVW